MLVTKRSGPSSCEPLWGEPFFACHVPSNDRPLVSLLESYDPKWPASIDRPLVSLLESYGNDSLLVSEREF